MLCYAMLAPAIFPPFARVGGGGRGGGRGGGGSLCEGGYDEGGVVLLFGVLVISEPQCLKSGPLRGSGPPDRWSDDFQYAGD